MDKLLKVTQILPGIESLAAGTSYSVPKLAHHLQTNGCQVELMTVQDPDKLPKFEFDFDFELSCYSASPISKLTPKLYCSPNMVKQISAIDDGIIHTHGTWCFPNYYPSWYARKERTKIVLSPRGMLGIEAMKFSKRKKQIIWTLLAKDALSKVNAFHATAESEVDEIRRHNFNQPIALIPNGIDVPREESLPSRLDDATDSYVLSLGRIHPKKSLSTLIRVWNSIVQSHPNLKLRIVGPSEANHARELIGLINEMGLNKSISVEGPVFGEEKIDLMARAKLFVLPTLNENFALTVAESLSVKTPVISTKGAPWSGLEQQKCGWWIDHSEMSLYECLMSALKKPVPELEAMGHNGRIWMQNEFDWSKIASNMKLFYNWLNDKGDKPDFVYL